MPPMQRRQRLRVVDQQRSRAALRRLFDEGLAIVLATGQRREQEPGLDHARIRREAADVGIAVRRWERGGEEAVHELS